MFPDDPGKLKATIRKYERNMKAEEKQFGMIMDRSGTRYLLGPMYLLAEDLEGALRSFEWFNDTFSDDTGEPAQYLCWTLALYRSGNKDMARRKLGQTMLMNLYIIPRLLGIEYKELDIWHGSNFEEPEYIESVPEPFFNLWDEEAMNWASDVYQSDQFQKIRSRYIEIQKQLKHEPVGSKRTSLVNEASRMEAFDYSEGEV